MQIVLIGSAPERLPVRPRTLVIQRGHAWLWPGIPLTERCGPIVRAIDPDVARFWLTKLHGPEANDRAISTMLDRAATCLADGNEAAAQAVLDRAGFERLSPEGEALIAVVARRLCVTPPQMPVLARAPLLRPKDIHILAGLFDQFAETASWIEKASGSTWDPSKHPRLGADPNPGWFASTSGGTEPPSPPRIKVTPRPGGGPLSEPPPELPEKPPTTEKGRNHYAKLAARWLLKAAGVAIDIGGRFGPPQLRLFLNALHAAIWLYDKYPIIQSYLDSAKPLAELQRGVSDPQKGYNVHHIVEQTPARKDGFPESKIEGADNLVLVPTIKHWEITTWYDTPNSEYDYKTPREYLRKKDWSTRYKLGLKALKMFGVLK